MNSDSDQHAASIGHFWPVLAAFTGFLRAAGKAKGEKKLGKDGGNPGRGARGERTRDGGCVESGKTWVAE